jgi:hypothetical protein
MPPLTRTALLAGLAAFLLSMVLFKPGAVRQPVPVKADGGVVLLSADDPLAIRTTLLDESLAFLPSSPASQSASGGYQLRPEDSPFPGFGPVLRFEPGKRPELPFDNDFSKITAPPDAINVLNGDILSTFSSTIAPLDALKPRSFICRVSSNTNQEFKPITIEVVDNPILKSSKAVFSEINMLIGVDSLGLLGRPTLIRTSGDKILDQAVLGWVGSYPWDGKIPPGVYQISVGP